MLTTNERSSLHTVPAFAIAPSLPPITNGVATNAGNKRLFRYTVSTGTTRDNCVTTTPVIVKISGSQFLLYRFKRPVAEATERSTE